MKRFALIVFGCLVGTMPLSAGDAGVKQTIAYVQKLQMPSGGFLASAGKGDGKSKPTLRSTSAAVRALHYLGAEVPNKDACVKFVAECHDSTSGGFDDRPYGPNGVDVFPTAVGLMAVTELKMPIEKYADGAIKYMSDKAKSFEDIRIAAAGMEQLHRKSPKNEDWLKEVVKLKNADGTFGKAAGQARATGGSVVTHLRFGAVVPDKDKDTYLKVLRDGQRQNGGWGKEDDATASDLETSYRVMRCFMMLKARPANVEGIRSFIAKCRNQDGGYGIAPGQPSSVGSTYFAAIIMHWLKE